LTGVFTPTPYSPSLEAVVVPSAESIANAVRELVKE
jgi:pyruvate/2-oxoglutarate/acetoin dehydrogenase E1 component